jgi:RNA polymerase sigma-70 factor (ECF subfamily)
MAHAVDRTGSSDPAAGMRAPAVLVLEAINDAASRWLRPAALGGNHRGGLVVSSVDGSSTPRHPRTGVGVSGGAGSVQHQQAPLTPKQHDDNLNNPDSEPDSEPDSDHVATWQLVALAQGGDGEAFGELYDRYVDGVYRFIYFRVHDRTLAEDFTSETFLRALRRIGTVSYQGNDIGAWFFTIARNIVLDHIKSARNRLEFTTSAVIETKVHAPSPEVEVLESLTAKHLMSVVDQLGDDQRECVMLRFIQGYSVSETAAVMGRNDGAIKALQHRAVRKLAELIGGGLQ